jgi:hypothetical protein
MTVQGYVYDVDNPYVRINYIAVVKRTNKGLFGNHKGQFKLNVQKRDTIIVSSKDFYPAKIVVRDSCQTSCKMKIGLRRKEYELVAVEILPIREHTQITKDIKELKEPDEIELVTAEGLSSPITALYQAFSKLERSKHEVAVLEAEDRKREVLKELLAKYVKADIIQLEEEQFDEFLSVANFRIDYLRNLSDYHLIKYVQYKYESFLIFSEFYNVVKRLYRNQYEFMLLEAQGEKMTIVQWIFNEYVDKNIYRFMEFDPDFLFEFLNYSQFNIPDLITMSDYGVIATMKRKYDKYLSLKGIEKR